MKAATKALTKMEFDSHSTNGSPWDERKIVGASSVSADARIVENGMVLRTSRLRIQDCDGGTDHSVFHLPNYEEWLFYQTLETRQPKRGVRADFFRSGNARAGRLLKHSECLRRSLEAGGEVWG